MLTVGCSRTVLAGVFAVKVIGPDSFFASHIPSGCQLQLVQSFCRLLGNVDPHMHAPDLGCGLVEVITLADVLTMVRRAIREWDACEQRLIDAAQQSTRDPAQDAAQQRVEEVAQEQRVEDSGQCVPGEGRR